MEGDSVVSQLARVVFDGYAPLYYLVQAATALILVLAANTAFSDFPRLARLSPRPASLAAQPMLVPVRELNRVTWNAVEYAPQLSRDVIGVHVVREHDGAEEDLATRWEQILPDVPLVLIESPYRTFLGPFLAYADSIGTRVGGTVTVVVPEFRPDHWWERFPHNRTGRLIEDAAEDYPRLAVTALTVRLPRDRST